MPRFHPPLIEPDLRLSRIWLSEKASRRRSRKARSGDRALQAHEPQRPVQVRQRIAISAWPPHLVLTTQPPAQPRPDVAVHAAKGFPKDAAREVVPPADQNSVQRGDALGVLHKQPPS